MLQDTKKILKKKGKMLLEKVRGKDPVGKEIDAVGQGKDDAGQG